ncbi:MAG: N-acetylmuramoyl-L-alanine amidase family protein [Bacillota bacterium]|uniref:N-acetylmuramoyl-L-alanine amidase n=2 Tax=Carboxydocella TaxID=178898 RepID=A0A1T4RYD5_9FIRM|nr:MULTISPECIES: N-acetylmuramoyl-L-alanine amidase [Carboxydocella]AVX21404.1 N-acetylmuramoyl-L-alanine amidase [Carboxydocella thermautotrophica]AVX31893.1 N-acetylmuramoyl-L-alanine amidase [Carboxydocella thermautotrophica]SKA20945.1 N-acetylmuramoyl-L-alanine amidase [Carboxydocella sporoproducens DSM 16521]
MGKPLKLLIFFYFFLTAVCPARAEPPLAGQVIMIDPGHGGIDPGAIIDNIYEKDINLAVALQLAELLQQDGAEVVLTRSDDRDYYPSNRCSLQDKRQDLTTRVEMAIAAGATLFISLHVNKDRHPGCWGSETYYYPGSAEGQRLAEAIQAQLKKVQPENRRPAKPGDYFLLRATPMPAVIVEMGFISNSRERALLLSPDWQKNLAMAIRQGIIDFFWQH